MSRLNASIVCTSAHQVKLEPSEVRGWNALARCYFKKGDLAAARDCLLQGIARVGGWVGQPFLF